MSMEEVVLVTTKWQMTYGGDRGREFALSAAVRGAAVSGSAVDGHYSTVLLSALIDPTQAPKVGPQS